MYTHVEADPRVEPPPSSSCSSRARGCSARRSTTGARRRAAQRSSPSSRRSAIAAPATTTPPCKRRRLPTAARSRGGACRLMHALHKQAAATAAPRARRVRGGLAVHVGEELTGAAECVGGEGARRLALNLRSALADPCVVYSRAAARPTAAATWRSRRVLATRPAARCHPRRARRRRQRVDARRAPRRLVVVHAGAGSAPTSTARR